MSSDSWEGGKLCSSQKSEQTTPNTKTQPPTKQNKTRCINYKTIKEEFWFYWFFNTLILHYFTQGIERKTRSTGIRGTGGPLVVFKSFVPPPHPEQLSHAVPGAGISLSSKHIVLDPRQHLALACKSGWHSVS